MTEKMIPTINARYVYKREGKSELRLAGFIDLLNQAGYKRIEIQMLVWPGMIEGAPGLCVVKAIIEGADGRLTEALGESSPINTNEKGSGKYQVKMAEARALSAAISRMFNVDDDLAELDESHPAQRPPPTPTTPLARPAPAPASQSPAAAQPQPAPQAQQRPAGSQPPISAGPGPASERQINAIYAIGRSLGWVDGDIEKWCEVNGLPLPSDMSKQQASDAIGNLNGVAKGGQG